MPLIKSTDDAILAMSVAPGSLGVRIIGLRTIFGGIGRVYGFHQTLAVRFGQSRPALFFVDEGRRITSLFARSGLNFRCNAKKYDE